ncbi:hypothetical protein ACHAWF_001051, partial [Thalassiosira exigua]
LWGHPFYPFRLRFAKRIYVYAVMRGTGGWVDVPEEFGRDVKDLSPAEEDRAKKSLYVITFDDQQRDFSAPPKYYGLYWSAVGPGPVNRVAVSLWDRFLGDRDEDSRDFEDNLNGERTGEGECYSGFACFGYGSIAISLAVDRVTIDNPRQVLGIYNKGLLKEAMALCKVPCDDLGALMTRLSKGDKECRRRINVMIGGCNDLG